MSHGFRIPRFFSPFKQVPVFGILILVSQLANSQENQSYANWALSTGSEASLESTVEPSDASVGKSIVGYLPSSRQAELEKKQNHLLVKMKRTPLAETQWKVGQLSFRPEAWARQDLMVQGSQNMFGKSHLGRWQGIGLQYGIGLAEIQGSLKGTDLTLSEASQKSRVLHAAATLGVNSQWKILSFWNVGLGLDVEQGFYRHTSALSGHESERGETMAVATLMQRFSFFSDWSFLSVEAASAFAMSPTAWTAAGGLALGVGFGVEY